MIGTYVLSAGYYDAFYVKAQKIRTLIKRDFETVYAEGVDAILTPATPSAAFAVGEKGSADPVEMYLNDVFTVTVNMAGLPGISVPAGSSADGLPLGLQLIGKPFEEAELFALAAVMEQAAPQGRAAAAVVVVTRRRSGSGPAAASGADRRCRRAAGWADCRADGIVDEVVTVKQATASRPASTVGSRRWSRGCATRPSGSARRPIWPRLLWRTMIEWVIAYEDEHLAPVPKREHFQWERAVLG